MLSKVVHTETSNLVSLAHRRTLQYMPNKPALQHVCLSNLLTWISGCQSPETVSALDCSLQLLRDAIRVQLISTGLCVENCHFHTLDMENSSPAFLAFRRCRCVAPLLEHPALYHVRKEINKCGRIIAAPYADVVTQSGGAAPDADDVPDPTPAPVSPSSLNVTVLIFVAA